MSNKKKKTLLLNTLLLVFCVVIIALFCLVPNKKTVLEEKEVISYSINFDTDGGNDIATIKIDEGGTIVKPEDPVREGYIFIGWYVGDELFDFSSKVEDNIILKARWQEVAPDEVFYILSFDTAGGTTIANQTIKEGELPTKPADPTKEGYIFKGWKVNGFDYNFTNPIYGDSTLVAVWEEDPNKPEAPEEPEEPEKPEEPEVKTYTVNFDSAGGTKVPKQSIKENGKVSKPTNPTRTGYTFVEWQLNGKTYNFNSKVTKNITLKAIWKQVIVEKPKYTIRFDGNGATGTCSNLTVESGSTANLNTCKNNLSKNYYDFVNWKGSDGKTYTGSLTVTKDLTLTAQWKKMSFGINYANAGDAVTSNGYNLSLKQKYKPSSIIITYMLGNGKMTQNVSCDDGVCYTSNKMAVDRAVSFAIKFEDSDETFVGTKLG